MTFTLGKIKPNVPHAEVALWDTIPLLSSLMDDAAFLGSRVLPLVEDTAEDWYVAHHHDSPDGSYSLQIFVWPPGSWTRIHDHSTWGGFFCAVGSMLEVRYERLDNGSVPYHAHLKELWRVAWGREDGISTILPYERGIHRVGNPNEEPAISVHVYGPRLGEIDGRDYDPSRDYVCDRPHYR
jgi:predicted metal-dependent enzyme (double-stranded beta helix superfamily)